MSFESYTTPKRVIPKTPDAAGLPSDEAITQSLRASTIDSDPDGFWPEQRTGITGDGNYDPTYRAKVPVPAGVQGVGAAAFRLASL